MAALEGGVYRVVAGGGEEEEESERVASWGSRSSVVV